MIENLEIVVTGASGGIGASLIKLLSEMPDVHITAFTRNKLLLENQVGIAENVSVRQFDFLMFNDVQLRSSLSHLSKIDILINNAGYLINKPFEKLKAIEMYQMIQVNFTATMLFTQQCLPLLKKSEGAHVVNISSMGGVQGSVKFPGLAVYAAAKSAICSFTESLAAEYVSENIHVNCIALGATDTGMFREAFPEASTPRKPQEVAAFLLDFAINRRDLFNGKIVQLASTTP